MPRPTSTVREGRRGKEKSASTHPPSTDEDWVQNCEMIPARWQLVLEPSGSSFTESLKFFTFFPSLSSISAENVSSGRGEGRGTKNATSKHGRPLLRLPGGWALP